jgi:hypothetical protein
MLLNLTESFKTPRNFQAPQRGIVVYNDDPRRLGRVKCVIAGLIEGRLQDLPWISPWQGGESASSAKGAVPEIGSILTIEFKFEDVYTGFYTGAWKSSETATGAFNESYPDVSGSRDEYGNKTIINKKKGVTEFVHSSGSAVKFDSAGNASLKVAGKIQLQSASGKATATFDMDTGKITLDGEEVALSGTKTALRGKEHETKVGVLTESVSGSRSSKVAGGASDSVGGSYSRSVAGNSAEVVTGSTDNLYTLLHSSIYGAGKEETVVLGGILQKVLAGGIDVTVALGSMSYKLAAGSYSVNLIAGTIEISTLAGTFKCGNLLGGLDVDIAGGTKAGNKLGFIQVDPIGQVTVQATTMMTLKAVGPINVQSSAMVDIKAPIVSINKAAGGMALTTLTMPVVDTISGAPSIGVPTVLIG